MINHRVEEAELSQKCYISWLKPKKLIKLIKSLEILPTIMISGRLELALRLVGIKTLYEIIKIS